VLGLTSGHGGDEYDQLVSGGEVVLQLHLWDVHEHTHIGTPDAGVRNGAVLWFECDDFGAAAARAIATPAMVLEDVHVNPLAQHREIWLQDPDGYVVVMASKFGDLG